MLAHIFQPHSSKKLSSNVCVCLPIFKKLISSTKHHLNLSVPDTLVSLHGMTEQNSCSLCCADLRKSNNFINCSDVSGT
jgi:hypothetical protein